MVVGTLSFVQKGQTTGCSVQWTQWNSDIWWWGHFLWGKKVKHEDAVDAVCIGLVVYGGGDIVLWCKKVKPVDAVCSGHSGIVIYGGGDIVFGVKRSNQWMQYAVDTVCSGCSMQWTQ